MNRLSRRAAGPVRTSGLPARSAADSLRPRASWPSPLIAACLGLFGPAPLQAQDGTSTTTAPAPTLWVPEPHAPGTTSLDTGSAGEELREVPDVVDDAPGTRVRRLGGLGSMSFLSIRGSTPEQTQVYFDGIPLHGASGAFDLGTIPIDFVERITVHRGVTPLTLGPPLPGGALVLESRFAPDNGPRATLGGGSWGARSGTLAWQMGHAGSRTLVIGSVSGARGDFEFVDDNGTPLNDADDGLATRDNNGSGRVGFLARGRTTEGSIRATGLAFGTVRFADFPGNASAPAEDVSSTESALVGGLLVEHRPRDGSGFSWAGLLGLGTHGFVLDDRYGELSLGATTTKEATRLARLAWIPRVCPLDSLELLGIADFTMEQMRTWDLWEDGPAFVDSRAQIGGGAEVMWQPWDARVHVRVGSRVDGVFDEPRREYPAEGSGESAVVGDGKRFLLLSPRAEVRVTTWRSDAFESDLYAGASTGERVPSFSELRGNRGYMLGNPDLVPESRRQLDGGGSLDFAVDDVSARLDAGMYLREVEQLIAWQQNAQGVAVARNVRRAMMLGYELFATADWRNTVGASLSYTLLDALDRSDDPGLRNRRLPLQPVHELHVELRAGQPLVSLAWEIDAASSFFLDPYNTRTVPARVTHGASCVIAPEFAGHWELRARVDNLTDARTGEVTLPDGDGEATISVPLGDYLGYPLPGRTWYFSVTYAR